MSIEKIIFGYGTSDRSGFTMHYGWYEDMGLEKLPEAGTWNHVAVTFDGYKEKIYLNGKFITEKDIFLTVGECEILTLGSKSDTEHPFTGYLHNLKLYDTAFTPEEIAADFAK